MSLQPKNQAKTLRKGFAGLITGSGLLLKCGWEIPLLLGLGTGAFGLQTVFHSFWGWLAVIVLSGLSLLIAFIWWQRSRQRSPEQPPIS